MTVLWGDTGKVATGTLKKFDIALATPRENLLGTPEALPSTEPGTAQVSITIQTSDLPTITPTPLGVSYTALLYVAGKNTDAAAQSVSYKIFKNGSQVATGSHASISANQFWTHGHFQFFGVVVGDVLDVKVWSPSANVNYDYYGLMVNPTRMNLGNAAINKDVAYSTGTAQSFTLGTPSVQLSQSFNYYPSDATNLPLATGVAITFGALRWNSTYFAGRVQMGDNNITTSTLTHATARPYYTRNNIPPTISFREVLR